MITILIIAIAVLLRGARLSAGTPMNRPDGETEWNGCCSAGG